VSIRIETGNARTTLYVDESLCIVLRVGDEQAYSQTTITNVDGLVAALRGGQEQVKLAEAQIADEGLDPTCHVEAWADVMNGPKTRYGWHCLTHDQDVPRALFDSADGAITVGRRTCVSRRHPPVLSH
jgi:hypothetical protein